jgi:hypothetical protein
LQSRKVGSLGTEDNPSSSSQRDALLCTLLFAVCLLIAHPISNEGYVDDFSYARTALDFSRTGHIIYNGWAAPVEGWLPVWGALFIKLFGFSFNVMRLAMLPIGMASVYLFHRILTRFGIHRANAVIGTLTLVLTPLFLPLTASFMTDIPGLFVLLLCIYMCQRAVAATTNQATLLWLVSAAMLNFVGGTVRQTSWLGALIMVPATGWFLRKRPHVWAASLVAASISFAGVLAVLMWVYRQPNFVKEPSIRPGALHLQMLNHFAASLIKLFLCLLFIVLPILVGWLPPARHLKRTALLRIGAILCLLLALLALLHRHGGTVQWLMPWMIASTIEHIRDGVADQLQGSSVTLPIWLRMAITLFVAAVAVVTAEQVAHPSTDPPRPNEQPDEQADANRCIALWILGPFTLTYLVSLMPRAATFYVFDRYLLGLLPGAIVFLLILYQRRVAPALPAVSIVLLSLFAIYTIAGTHDFYADERAQDVALQQLLADGIPRNLISQSMPGDGWLQLSIAGHLDNDPLSPSHTMERQCGTYFAPFVPDLHLKYFLVYERGPCLKPTAYPSAPYRAWLPPFHRAIYIDRMPHSPGETARPPF